jgi:alpha-beta hydrolase superfamily lysophospholipase
VSASNRFRDAVARAIVRVSTAPVRRPFGASIPRRGVTAMRFASADGTSIHADVRAPEGAARATLVLAHGWRDGRRQLQFLAPALVARGFRVVAIDFRAHGGSTGGRVTIGASESHDARAAIEAARATSDTVGYLGFSMGASAYLLAGTEADAAVLDSPYDSLDGAIAARARRFGVSKGLEGAIRDAAGAALGGPVDRVRPIDAVSALKRPTLFVFASRDPWIDGTVRASFAERLAPASAMRVVPGGHARHFRRAWREDVVTFFDERL